VTTLLRVAGLAVATFWTGVSGAQVPPLPAPPSPPAPAATPPAPTASVTPPVPGPPEAATTATPPPTPPPDQMEDVPDPPKETEEPARKELECLTSDDGCKVDDLKTPTVPAFAIIGISPTDVETPRTPKELSVALYNAYNGGAVAQNVALDVAPYWLFAHPLLTYDEYVDASIPDQLLQNLSVSMATAAAPEAASTDIGLGVRTHVFLVEAVDKEAAKKLQREQERQALAVQKQIAHCDDQPSKPPCPALTDRVAKLGASEGDLKALGAAVQNALTSRTGVTIGFAGAVSSRSASDKFAPNDFRKAAGWVNLGYRGGGWEMAGLVRFTGVDAPEQLQFVDLGAKIGVFKPKWDLHAEAVYRVVSGQDPPVDNSGRVAGTFEFEVTSGVFVSTTFGKAADDESKEGTTFALFGLNFQAGERRVKQP
jgi:hypothetical protein